MIKATVVFFLALTCVGCYQGSSNGGDDLITTPVTNNPRLVPESERLNGSGAMPY